MVQNGFNADRELPEIRTGRRRTRSAGPSGAQVTIYAFIFALVGVAALLAYTLYQQRREAAAERPATSGIGGQSSSSASENGNQRPARARDPRSSTETDGDDERGPKSDKRPGPEGNRDSQPRPRPADKRQPKRDRPSADEPRRNESPGPESPAGGKRQQAFERLAADTRLAMSEHDLGSARAHLGQAAKKADTPDQRAEIDRLDTLLGHLEAFWEGMRRVVARLESTEELEVGETFVVVVEASRDELTIKVEGQLRTYQIDRIPSRLVQVLAGMRLARDPATKVLLGTYLLVDPKGDPARARQLWEEAAREGVKVENLIPELSRWAHAPSAPGERTSEKTAPPANEQKLDDAEQSVREKFKAQYERATGAAGKSQLAALLLETGGKTGDDMDLRFVLLCEARDQAAAGGDCELALEAIDAIAGFHTVDVLAMKTAALVEAARNGRGLGAQKQVAQRSLELVAQAVESRRLPEAKQLAETALSAARKSNSRSLMQEAVLVVQQVEALEKQGDE
ncbi:MAG: hypothetical protein ABIP48_29770 [Planctomycetota bacterium]